MNWRLKIIAKILLSRLPLDYRSFYRSGIFRHGRMQDADYALGVVMTHVERLGGEGRVRDAVCLELGPGDSLASALIASALGARKIYLVDSGDFADCDLGAYKMLAEEFRERGLPVPDLSRVEAFEEMMERLNAEYLTAGLASLRTIASGTVDLVWSHAVLEHVRCAELAMTFREFRRLCAPDARLSHRIDFKDHLGGSLNNLRFSERIWESEFMARSGFYTNRVRSSEMQSVMRDAGFDLLAVSAGKWEELPLPRERMAPPYRDLPEDDLLTCHVDILAAPHDGADRGQE